MTRRPFAVLRILILLVLAGSVAMGQDGKTTPNSKSNQIAPVADHHQHLFSPEYVKLQAAGTKTILAQDVIALLDKAGIRRAVLLSTAYRYGRPGAEVANEYNAVKAENDWTAAQAALYPGRLVAFCGFNPLKDYALDEMARCAGAKDLRYGIKMHFGNSDVQLENPEHFEKLKRVFHAANKHRLAIVVHMRASLSKQRPYGPEQARAFLELLAFAPNISVQVAHMASSGPGFVDPPAYSVLEVLAAAVANRDPRTRNLWFDLTSNPHPQNPADASQRLVKMIRQIGPRRILFGSDAGTPNNLTPSQYWDAFLQLKLTDKEVRTIAKNIAPYLR